MRSVSEVQLLWDNKVTIRITDVLVLHNMSVHGRYVG